MPKNNSKIKIVRLEENQKRLEENIQENRRQLEELNSSFKNFTENHFNSFKSQMIVKMTSFENKLKNNTKLIWFLLSLLLGLYALIISILAR